jgi:hypothetical protein
MNADGVIDRTDGLGDEIVACKSAGALVRRSADLPASVNRQPREHRGYAEKNEQYFLSHGGPMEGNTVRVGVIRLKLWSTSIVAPRMNAYSASYFTETIGWHSESD